MRIFGELFLIVRSKISSAANSLQKSKHSSLILSLLLTICDIKEVGLHILKET